MSCRHMGVWNQRVHYVTIAMRGFVCSSMCNTHHVCLWCCVCVYYCTYMCPECVYICVIDMPSMSHAYVTVRVCC